LNIASKIGNRQREGICLNLLGDSSNALGEIKVSIEFYEKALSIFREIGDLWEEGRTLGELANVYFIQGQIEQSNKLYEKALHIARKIGHRRGICYQLLGLSKVLLTLGNLNKALLCCKEALNLNMPEINFQATLMLGIILLRSDFSEAKKAFENAINYCEDRINRMKGLYKPHYIMAASLVGCAVCNLNWSEKNKRKKLLTPALKEYQRALRICNDQGVIQEALCVLEMIRKSGIEGLEPIYLLFKIE